MSGTGVCCSSLEQPKALMKMGLSVVLIGHINFLLGALVHGVVLRHINLHKQARAMEYAISNVMALTSGLVGVIVGILAIILSKNKKSRGLTWSLFSVSLLAALMAAASAIGLFVSTVRAIIHGGRSLLTHCRFPDAIGYSSVTNECPFDPTRIYSTTLILWIPLIVTCVIQLVFSARCFAVCVSFLGLPCCPTRKRPRNYTKAINVVRTVEVAAPSRYTEPPRSSSQPVGHHTEPPRSSSRPVGHLTEPARSSSRPVGHPTEPPRSSSRPVGHHTESPRSSSELPRWNTGSQREERRPQHVPRQHQSLPPSERRPLYQPHRERSNRERSNRERPDSRPGSRQRATEQHQLLERGTLERSSFWI